MRSARYARLPWLTPFRWRLEVGSLRSPPLAHAVPLSFLLVPLRLPAALRCRSGWPLALVLRSPFALRALFVLIIVPLGLRFWAARSRRLRRFISSMPLSLRRSGYASAPPRAPTLPLRCALRFLLLRRSLSATLRALAVNQTARQGSVPLPSLRSGFAPLRTGRAVVCAPARRLIASCGLVLAAARFHPLTVLSVVRYRAY